MGRTQINQIRQGVNFSTCGLALIEMLIAAGIMMTVTLALAALLIQVQKENKALSQKLDILHLDQQIARYLTNPTSCTCMFQNTVLNSTSKDVSPLKAGCPNPNPPPDLAATGEPLNGSSSVKVASVTLNNIMTISSSVKTADLTITFDQSKLVIPLKNVTLNGILFQVNADQTIASCEGKTSQQTCESLGGTWSGSKCSFDSTSQSTLKALYLCPEKSDSDCGSGLWFSQGCVGQLSTNSGTCSNITYTNTGGCTTTFDCEKIGNVRIEKAD